MERPPLTIYAVRAHFLDGTTGDLRHWRDEADAHEHRQQLLHDGTKQNAARQLLGVANVTVVPVSVW
jgi:hypothetical protein